MDIEPQWEYDPDIWLSKSRHKVLHVGPAKFAYVEHSMLWQYFFLKH